MGDLVDQVLHLAQELGGRFTGLDLLGLEAIALGLERRHLRPQVLDLTLGALGEASLRLRACFKNLRYSRLMRSFSGQCFSMGSGSGLRVRV